METTKVICPKCGAIAEVENYYLGGYGWHLAYFCQADHNHQGPLVRDNGRYHEAIYRRDGLSYTILRKDQAERERAERECLTDSDYLARMDGGEAWQYEPELPPTEPPWMAEYEEPVSRPAYLAITIPVYQTKEA